MEAVIKQSTPEQVAKDNPAVAKGFGGIRNLAAWLRYLNR